MYVVSQFSFWLVYIMPPQCFFATLKCNTNRFYSLPTFSMISTVVSCSNIRKNEVVELRMYRRQRVVKGYYGNWDSSCFWTGKWDLNSRKGINTFKKGKGIFLFFDLYFDFFLFWHSKLQTSQTYVGLELQPVRIMWSEFVVVSHLALRVFFQVLWFSSLHKTTPNSNSNSTIIEEPHENQLMLMWLPLLIL